MAEVIIRDLPPLFWEIYHIIIAILIIIDLVAAGRREALTYREATIWSIIWVGFGVGWGVLVYYLGGEYAAGLYYSAFLIEKTLSMDNLFVFAVIFSYFNVPLKTQPIVLYVGIITAIVLRALFIYGGILLIEMFHWTIIIFGVILVLSGYKLTKGHQVNVDPGRNPIIRFAKKFMPIHDKYIGSKFITIDGGKIKFTPLILVLLAIETTDIVFAVDSVPAVLAITTDFFIAYTSNISAILGLRALYFLIAITLFRFKYVSKGLAIILVYLGVKMLLQGFEIYKIPVEVSVITVFTVISVSILASIILRGDKKGEE